MKSIVTISRKWNSPSIETTVYKQGENDNHILLKIALDDFMEALKQEFLAQGQVTWIMKEAEFIKRVDIAKSAVVEGVKCEWLKHPD